MHIHTGCYALDALPGLERQDFGRHLEHCGSCEAEVRGLRETAARLAMAKALQPPAHLEHQVLAATYRTRQLPPLAGDRLGPRHRRASVLLSMRRPDRRHGGDQRLARPPRLVAAVAALAVAVAITLGVTQILARHQTQAPSAGSAAITQVITAPDARAETMRTNVGGMVTLIVSARQRAAVITVTGMPSLPRDRAYQVWVLTPSGARRPACPPTRQVPPLLAAAVLPADRIGITVEPAGGTSEPTTPPVVVLPLPA